jgi:hypothetical protein
MAMDKAYHETVGMLLDLKAFAYISTMFIDLFRFLILHLLSEMQ